MAGTTVVEVLFPELGNLAGDNGNADYLRCCLPEAEFVDTPSQREPYFASHDVSLVVLGNMCESAQLRALARLRPHARRLAELADAGVPVLFTGSACELLGESLQDMDGEPHEGLGILPFSVSQHMPHRYLSAFEGSFEPGGGEPAITVLGFHAEFTQVEGDNTGCFFARGSRGWGINEGTQLDGFRRGGLLATALLGPLLPTNPDLCAWLLRQACGREVPLAFEDVARRAFARRQADFEAVPASQPIVF